MKRIARLLGSAALLLLLCVGSSGAAESFLTGNPSAEGKARSADFALSRHALAQRSNPAGLGLIEGNREDAYGLALWNTLDYDAGSLGGWNNGDAPAFGFQVGFAFVPSRFLADPLLIWTRRTERDAPYASGGFTGHDRIQAPVKVPPSMVALRMRGIGFRVGEIAIRAQVSADKITREYAVPEPDPLPGQRVKKVEVAFHWRQDGRPGKAATTVNCKAYGMNRAVLLGKTMDKWVPATISIPLAGVYRPADVKLTCVGETFVELRRIVILRTVAGPKGDRVVRFPVPDDKLRLRVDEGLSTVLIDSTAATFEGKTTLKDVFVAAGFDFLDMEKVRAVSLSYRYGFAGRGRTGEVALVVDGKVAGQRSHVQPKVLTMNEERLAYLRRNIKRFEKDKFHLGLAFFTDAWLAADYNDAPTRAGTHEEQVRYAMFSASPAVAYEVRENLSVGLSLDVFYSRFSNLDTMLSLPTSLLRGPGGTYGSTGALYAAQTGNDSALFQFDTDKLSAFGAGARAGVIWEPDTTVSVGLMACTPSILTPHQGEAVVDLSDDFLFSAFTPVLQANVSLPLGGLAGFEAVYDVKLENFRLPAQFGLGVAFRPVPEVTLAADVTWIPWWLGRKDYLRFAFSGGTNPDLNVLMGGDFTARVPFELLDQIVVGVGLSADVTRDWRVHAGYRYASNPLTDMDLLPLFPVHLEHHLSLGLTFKVFTLQFHVALTHGFGATLETDRSSHGSDRDGARFYAQENSLLMGVSYRY